MRNLLKISAIGLTLLLLVGCGNKKVLKCSINDDAKEISGKNTVTSVFKDDKIVKMTLGVESTFSDKYKSYMDSMVKALDDQYKDLNKKKGISYKTVKKGNKVKMTLSADLDKMDEDTKSEFNFVGNSETYKEAKKELEVEGYTCK